MFINISPICLALSEFSHKFFECLYNFIIICTVLFASIMFSLIISPFANYVTMSKSEKEANIFNVFTQIIVLRASYGIYYFYSPTWQNIPLYFLNLIFPTYTKFFILILVLMYGLVSDFHSHKIPISKPLPIKYLCIFDVDPRFALVFLLFSIMINFLFSSFFLKRLICPRIRLKLNRQ